MNKKLLLLIPSIFLVASCSQSSGGDTPHDHIDVNPKDHKCDVCSVKLSDHVDSNKDDYCDICNEYMGSPTDPEKCEDDDEVCKAQKSGSAAKCTPGYPFYLKVGEKKKLRATMKDTQIEEEKHFNWENLDTDHIKLEVAENDDTTAYVTALSAPLNGFSKIKVTNKVAPSITGEFNAKVVDFDEVNDYLWQCGDTVDRTVFGYKSKSENPAGIKSGTAALGNINWTFERSAVNALNSGYGSLAFGKGTAPESFTLKAENKRKVKEIIVESASANSLGRLTVSVGESKFDTVVLPKASNSKLTYLSIDCQKAAGDILLDFKTPDYDPSKASDDDYKAPGATYLKSIRILYEQEECLGIKVSDTSKHQFVFTSWDKFTTEGLEVKRITESGEYVIPESELDIETPEFSEESNKETVNISYVTHNGTFKTSYDVYRANSLAVSGTPEVTDYLEYSKFNPKGLKVTAIVPDVEDEIDFTDYITWCDSSKYNESKGTASSLELVAGTSVVKGFVNGIKELGSVDVIINAVQEIERLVVETSEPKTVTYLESTTFKQEGLVVKGYGEFDTPDPVEVQDKLSWYDAPSYENNPENPENWSTRLAKGTTAVVGKLADRAANTVKIDGLTVVPIDHITSTGTLSITEYSVGDNFAPTGLTFNLYSNDESLKLTKVKGEEFDWYDGASYDAEPQVKTKALAEGTTYVVGEFKFNQSSTIKISGITVTTSTNIVNVVTSCDNLEEGDQILVVTSLNGHYLNMKETSSNGYKTAITNDLSENSFNISSTVKTSLLTLHVVDKENHIYTLSLIDGTKEKFVGVGSNAITASPSVESNKQLKFEFDSNKFATLTGTYTNTSGTSDGKTNYLSYSTKSDPNKFTFNKTGMSGGIKLYKLI